MASRNWIKELIDQKRAREEVDAARKRALALAALGNVNPTDEELTQFTPGVPITAPRAALDARPSEGTPEGAVDPALAAATNLELRAEELNRAALGNAPAVTRLRQALAMQDSGIDFQKLASARVYNTRADDEDYRAQRIREISDSPDTDPILRADILQNKAVADRKPNLVKVRERDGTERYYNARPRLDGRFDYEPADDAQGNTLRVPPGAAAGDRPTALQKNTAFLARVLFSDDPDAEAKSAELLTRLKDKPAPAAWESLTREVMKMQYGRYARDPQKLYEKTAEMWRIARPLEPVPVAPPPMPAPAPAAPGKATPAPAAPAPSAANVDIYQQAREAIARGAKVDAVKARLKQLGGDPGKL